MESAGERVELGLRRSKDGDGGGSDGASRSDAMTRAYLAAVALRVRRDFAVGIHVRSGLRFPEGSPRGVDARRASSTFQRGSAHAEWYERSLGRFSFVIRPGMPKREGVGDLSPQWKP